MEPKVKSLKLSFVIPTLNEEKNIRNTIESILDTMNDTDFEVIISDNGSSDNTITIAESLGAKTLYLPGLTIGSLRNAGAKISDGNYLIFLDADVTLSISWKSSFLDFLGKKKYGDRPYITGSTCLPVDSDSYITKYWFNLILETKSNYINSGHLIISRSFFNEIKGFDDNLKTSEDVELCDRAQKLGAIIIKNKDLIAYHKGYPTSLNQFFKREAWHGREDFRSIRSIIQSKSALASLTNAFILLTGALLSIINGSLIFAIGGLILSQIFCILLTLYKFQILDIKKTIHSSICLQLYLLGRVLSPLMKTGTPRER